MAASAPTSFDEYAQRMGREIESSLERYTQWDEDCPPRLREAIRHSLLAPGKRLRPLLVLMAAEACGSPGGEAMPAACAVELVHTYSLIHDDLPAMDDDDMRRGRPSCHAKFGEALAILAGDALLARAFEILSRDVRPAETAVSCCQELARAAGATALVGGQADDLDAERTGGDMARLLAIHRRKTGALLEVCLRLGGLVASATERQFEALREYGQQLGLAFQIVDDLLDLDGNEAALGKRTGKDQDRGKLTFPGVMGREASRREAERLVSSAREALVVFGSQAGGLDALARFVVERKR
ncbi:MAG: polyprenyl synthetase family protein [Pirellulaceae bacterium]|nr:polyprenyl synthetase family protein [Pirellulaceae bacterium]